jgi:hypothetical protein
LEDQTGWSHPQVYRFLHGKAEISRHFAEDVERVTGVDPIWLLTGAGSMNVTKETKTQCPKETSELHDQEPDYKQSANLESLLRILTEGFSREALVARIDKIMRSDISEPLKSDALDALLWFTRERVQAQRGPTTLPPSDSDSSKPSPS